MRAHISHKLFDLLAAVASPEFAERCFEFPGIRQTLGAWGDV